MDRNYEMDKIQKWYQEYSDDIYRFILLMIGDHEQAKDLTHDTFLKAYGTMSQYQGITSEKNWLYHIARNTTIDYMRKGKPIQYFLETVGSIPATNTSCPETIAEMGEREEQLYFCLKKLKRSYQEVIILRKVKELSTKEAAEILGWSEGKVKTTLHRALEALKKQLVKGGYTHEII
ncbi:MULTISPECIES: RNA polymerase sigma factor [Bacillaceae]|uniref:RNA polymerase sigma factor n=1 Tax=Bacillaceae TaxID=186817 RepID=UPI001F1F6F95|nr:MULTISPECIES: RNA polymerase sigma factor [Bacillaceae]